MLVTLMLRIFVTVIDVHIENTYERNKHIIEEEKTVGNQATA